MSNYTKTVDFAAKDTLPSGDSGKIIKGTEFETEFDNIATAVATKADSAAPTFTGTSVFTNLDINGTVQADGAVTVGVDDTGYDVKFFGATAGKSLLWDESADSLIVTGTTTLVGTTNLDAVDVDGNMTFGDNNKAIFGADSDLQLYHDGSHSYIVDAGTGNMYVSTNGNGIVMQASLSETMFAALPNGAVTLYHDNAAKLATTAAGIDVTGSVTADGLTVEGASVGGTYITSSSGSAAGDIKIEHIIDASRSFNTINSESGSGSAIDLALATGGSEAMRIDSSQNLLVGKTAANSGTVGIEARSTGRLFATADGAYAAKFERLSSDGTLIQLTQDAAPVGAIGVIDGDLVIHSAAAGHEGLRLGNGAIVSTDNAGATTDAACNLGGATSRFTNLYLSGGVVFGTTGGAVSSKTLDDYEEGTWTPVIAGGTCTNMTGKYTKVGNQVTVILAVVNGNLAGTSGNVITGLPFTSTTRSTSGAVAFYNIFSVDDPVGYLGAGVTSINFIQNTASSSWSVANFSNSAATYFHFSLTYFV